MRTLRVCATVLARFFISAAFLGSGMNKLLHWQEEEKLLLDALSDWQGYALFSEELQTLFALLASWTPLFLAIATLCEFVGGLLILLGIREKLGAFLLVLVLAPTTLILHQFWFLEGPQRDLQVALFLKNLAILGALFLILLHGAKAGSTTASASSFPKLKLGYTARD